MRHVSCYLAVILAFSLFGLPAVAAPAGSEFSYQGQLVRNGVPVDGEQCIIEFSMFDALTAGTQVAGPNGSQVVLTDGLFTTSVDFGPDVFDGDAYWLEVSLYCPGDSSVSTLSPRQLVRGAPYAHYALGPWKTSGSDLHYDGGNIGVGTASPQASFHAFSSGDAPGIRFTGQSSMTNNEVWGESSIYQGGTRLGRSYWKGQGSGNPDFVIDTRPHANTLMVDGSTGRVGVNATAAGGVLDEQLEVYGDVKVVTDSDVNGGVGSGGLFLVGSTESSGLHLDTDEIQTIGSDLYVNNDNLHNTRINNNVWVRTNGNVGIGVSNPTTRLEVAGTTTTTVLTITGGSDLSESFDVLGPEGRVLPGMVVSIDAERPGGLMLSKYPYDRTVAGVISGAGGISTGMLMGQQGSVADGEHPVALTGRVYVWADATDEPIEPGDLLTTSGTPGHAMRVVDPSRAQGAVLGKAMTSLKEGRGLVLTLVTLQ